MEIDEVTPPPEASWKFVEELRKPAERHFRWTRALGAEGEASLAAGITIERGFAEAALDTATVTWSCSSPRPESVPGLSAS